MKRRLCDRCKNPLRRGQGHPTDNGRFLHCSRCVKGFGGSEWWETQHRKLNPAPDELWRPRQDEINALLRQRNQARIERHKARVARRKVGAVRDDVQTMFVARLEVERERAA